MKKKVFLVFTFLLLLSLIFINAQNTTEEKAYSCLQDKVKDKCSSLSTEEKIFSLLSVGECKSALTSDSLTQECWPSSECKIKTTSQAILALSRSSISTKKAEDYLFSSKATMNYTEIEWLLQVESPNATSCTATYSGSTNSFILNEDKTLSGNPGSCLSLYQNYWFKVSPSCYNREIKISCSNSFLTSLLYKKTTSSKLYISDETHSASGSGSTTEKASSACFKEGSSCNYEGTLWASIILKYRGYNVSSYIPYLILNADDNSKYLPESFLYILTNDFRTELLAKQKENRWWLESGDNFYDTAVALLPFQNEDVAEKENSKAWLTEIQGTDGCWQGNIRNTGFLLYSLWPKKTSSTGDLSADLEDCEDSGYFCMSQASCDSVSGNILDNYGGCFLTNKCCSKEKPLERCTTLGGELCSSDEFCSGGKTEDSSDSNSAKFCCVPGECIVKQASECEINNGACKNSCGIGEEIEGYSCTPTGGVCCVTKKTSYVWLIILLVILIILTALGIIYRKKLKDFFLKLKHKFKFGKGKGKPSTTPGPRFPPTSSSRIYPRAVPRRIISNQVPSRRPSQIKSEFDDVLKKLKEIGK